MIVVHTSCFDESTELQEMLKIFEQKQDLTHFHFQHLKDEEDWDEALDLIIKADRIISIWDVFPSFDSSNNLSYFRRRAGDFSISSKRGNKQDALLGSTTAGRDESHSEQPLGLHRRHLPSTPVEIEEKHQGNGT